MGTSTISSPAGAAYSPLNLQGVVNTNPSAYYARTTVYHQGPMRKAIREAIERHPGTQARVDLAYLWPSLAPPDLAVKPTVGAPVDPNKRVFVTIASGDLTLPVSERMHEIYPRYLMPEPSTELDGLTLRLFREGTPYQGEELVFEQQNPEHFLARCSRKGVVNSGTCLLERRIGNADVTFRFPRDWLKGWKSVAAGIDKLLARLHPAATN